MENSYWMLSTSAYVFFVRNIRRTVTTVNWGRMLTSTCVINQPLYGWLHLPAHPSTPMILCRYFYAYPAVWRIPDDALPTTCRLHERSGNTDSLNNVVTQMTTMPLRGRHAATSVSPCEIARSYIHATGHATLIVGRSFEQKRRGRLHVRHADSRTHTSTDHRHTAEQTTPTIDWPTDRAKILQTTSRVLRTVSSPRGADGRRPDAAVAAARRWAACFLAQIGHGP